MEFLTQVWRRALSGMFLLILIVFFSAGQLDYWQGWVYIDLSLIVLLVTAWVLRENPGLISERLHPGPGTKAWDKAYFALSTPLYFMAIVMAGIDVGRGHWTTRFPAGFYMVGIILFVFGQALFLWAKKVNFYFSSVVRIQTDRGQTVCCEGPYQFVRHPGYLAGIVFGLATPLILGSLWALIPQGLAAALLVARTALEDRTLQAELPGYLEYCQSVTYCLIPRVW